MNISKLRNGRQISCFSLSRTYDLYKFQFKRNYCKPEKTSSLWFLNVSCFIFILYMFFLVFRRTEQLKRGMCDTAVLESRVTDCCLLMLYLHIILLVRKRFFTVGKLVIWALSLKRTNLCCIFNPINHELLFSDKCDHRLINRNGTLTAVWQK